MYNRLNFKTKMKKISFRLLSPVLTVVLFSLSFFTFLNPSLAQDTVSLAVSPPTFELSANPGDTLENTIRVENLTDKPLEISVDRRNFTALGEEGAVGLTEEETSFSLASWITVSPEKITIPAKRQNTFTFTTKIPVNAEPGGHFGSIIFKTGGKKPGETGAALSQELGALVLLRVAGNIKEEASLESFSAKKAFWSSGPVGFEARVKNEGNVHLKPTGKVVITNFLGNEAAKIEVEPRNILPGAIRKIPATWDQKFLLGKYTATVSLVYGSQGEILTDSTTFFGFPTKIGVGILAGLIILIVVLYPARKRIRMALKVLFSGK